MEVTTTPTPTPMPEVIVMTNQPDLTYMNQFDPFSYVLNTVFLILMVIIISEAVVFVFQKIYTFAETAFDNGEKLGFFGRLISK